MTDAQLKAAQDAREDLLLSDAIDARLTLLFDADAVGPEARSQLRSLLKHYAKQAHPFRACVRDNIERFGPGRTEKVCATLKDLIRGTTRWRSNDDIALTDAPTIDDETARVLLSLSDEKLDALEMLVMEVQDS